MSRTVVITGAGGGLGSIFAKEFAKKLAEIYDDVSSRIPGSDS